MYFHHFAFIFPGKKARIFILIKLEFLLPKDALFKVWFKLAKLFWRWRFFKVVNLFLRFSNYLLLGKGMGLHLNKFVHSPKNALCQIWLDLAKLFDITRFLKVVIFFPISKLSPFWKGCVPKFDQTWIPFTQVCFLRSLVEIGLVVLKKRIFLSCQFIFTKKMKMWKVYRQRDGRTMDARRSEKLTWAFSSGELKMNPNIIRTLHQICLSPCFYKRRV